MSSAEAASAKLWPSFPIDLGWRNFAFALRTSLAGITALALAYWLTLQDPQWSILTVYLLAQPTTGAVLAKGAFRALGTVVGALWGLLVLSVYAEAPIPFVLAMVLWLGLCIYLAARTRNFLSYGFMLASFSAMLVGYQGDVAPTSAWQIALDRTTEILIGVACTSVTSVLILPRNAGEVLRASLIHVFAGLARYGAIVMDPTTPIETFVVRRRRMIGEVIGFDALRSYTRFESAEMRVDDAALRRMLREFLAVLAVARGLYFRLGDFKPDGPILDRLRPALQATAACLARIADDARAVAEPQRTRAALLAARRNLGRTAAELAALAGREPLDPLANAMLIVHRAEDMLHGLFMVMVTEEATLRATALGRRPRINTPQRLAPVRADPGSAGLQGLRAGLALLLVSIFWAATTWTAGFWAIVGLAVMLFVTVNQEDPGRIGWPYLFAVILALAAVYGAIAFVLPRLEDYGSLALFLTLALLPVGLVMGTPRFALAGAGFGSFFVVEIGTSNLFQPDPLVYMNNAIGLVFGMAACLAVNIGLLPVDAPAARRRAWAAMMEALPFAARGERPERAIAGEIFATLTGILPHLDLDKPADEVALRGSLGAASVGMELWRLHDGIADPDLPAPARDAIAGCLEHLADAFAHLPGRRSRRADIIDEAAAKVAATRAVLAGIALEPGSPAARIVLQAAASLRFLSDRFEIDRPFLLRSYA
jgi:uncharacterized membrane protein YccC